MKEQLKQAIESYEQGHMDQALAQFLALAEQQNEEAFLYLSWMFRDGEGVEKNTFLAKRYKRKYAQRIEALALMGVPPYPLKWAYTLQYGDGVKANPAQAMHWFLKLAQEEVGEAMFHLSGIYAHGWCGQAIDPEREMQWLEAAKAVEYPKALYHYALLLFREKDEASSLESVRLMQRASELGCWQAQKHLERTPR